MFTFLKNVFKKGELRQKVIFTLGILFVYRLGAAITIPSVNTGALSASDATNGIFGIMNLIGGGTLERFSLFSLYWSTLPGLLPVSRCSSFQPDRPEYFRQRLDHLFMYSLLPFWTWTKF